MKKRITILMLTILFSVHICRGEEKDTTFYPHTPNNSIYIEFVGNSLLYSLNYERKIFQKDWFIASCRIGGGYADISFSQPERVYVFPFTANGLFRTFKSWYVEFGSGITIKGDGKAVDEYPHEEWFYETIPYFTVNIGIRYQGKKGFLFRAGYTPCLDLKEKYYQRWWNLFGVSIGFSFGKKIAYKSNLGFLPESF